MSSEAVSIAATTTDLCTICLNPLSPDENITTLPCDHRLHTQCALDAAWRGCIACPVCRRVPTATSLTDAEINREDAVWQHNEQTMMQAFRKGVRAANNKNATQRLKAAVKKYRNFQEKQKQAAVQRSNVRKVHAEMRQQIMQAVQKIKNTYKNKYCVKTVNSLHVNIHSNLPKCSKKYRLRRFKRKIAQVMGWIPSVV